MNVTLFKNLICMALGVSILSCSQPPVRNSGQPGAASGHVGTGNIVVEEGDPSQPPDDDGLTNGEPQEMGSTPSPIPASTPTPASQATPMTSDSKPAVTPSQTTPATAAVATPRVPDLSKYDYSESDKALVLAESVRAKRSGILPDVDKNISSKSITSGTPGAQVSKGTVKTTSFASKNSKIYPGKKNADLSSDQSWSWGITVYLPSGFKAGEELPFMIIGDGDWEQHKTLMIPTLDNLIAQKRVPRMAAIFINAGPGDSGGSQRGYEYDKVDSRYNDFLETEIYPMIEQQFSIKLTKDPKGRGSMGGSSSANMAFTLAWFHPELYSRVVSYSGTFVNRRPSDNHPDGAWEYHSKMIPAEAKKSIRVALHVSQNDLSIGDKNNWLQANQNMAKVLGDKGYNFRFFKALNAGHIEKDIYKATLAETLEWVWLDYPIAN